MKFSIHNTFPAVAPFALLLLMALSQMSLSEKNILGHWSYEGANKEEIIQYKAVTEFPRTKGGIAFLEGGKLVVRQNAGWCGTPPISYRIFDGEWKWVDEKNIALKYAFWGGTIHEIWKIVNVDKNNLNIKRMKYETSKEPYALAKE